LSLAKNKAQFCKILGTFLPIIGAQVLDIDFEATYPTRKARRFGRARTGRLQ
jgi:hypothetical protein